MTDLLEIRPGRASLLRHRGADFGLVWERDIPRVDLRRGALWVRATDDGPGLIVSCGESQIHLRRGALAVEHFGRDALVVVASGRASVTGPWPQPRVVAAGHGVVVTPSGTVREPRTVAVHELVANPMVVENLVHDGLVSGSVGTRAVVTRSAVASALRPLVDGTPPPLLDLSDAALGSARRSGAHRQRRRPGPAPIVSGPDPRPDLVLRGAGIVSVRAEPSPLARTLARGAKVRPSG